MNDLECQACGTPAPAEAHHCERCGSADWRPLPPPPSPSVNTSVNMSANTSTDSAPVAPEALTRSKRNR